MNTNFLYDESNNGEYYYTFQIPFVVEVKNSYDIILNVLKTYTIEDLDSSLNDIILTNIDPDFFDDFYSYANEHKNLDVFTSFKNYIEENGGISNFNKEHDNMLDIDDVQNDADILDIITDSFDEQDFVNYFDNFDIELFELVDFNYKESSFNVDAVVPNELETDQIHMITNFLEDQCKNYWGKKLYEEVIEYNRIVLCGGKGKKGRVTYIGVTAPDNNDDDYYLDEEIDY